MTHWCRDLHRDEAVRASEDNRPGPLPTLEEAIAGVTQRRPVDAGGGGNVTGGLRTERVVLSLARMGELIEERDAAIRERDRIRENAKAEHNIAKAALDERDAAIRERESLREQLESVACRAATAENRVAELEPAAKLAPAANAAAESNHAPAASGAAGTGWLTAEEREALQYAIDRLRWASGVCNEAHANALDSVLARSSPPEVALPGQWKDAGGPGHPQVSWQPFLDTVTSRRDAEWLAALAAEGA